MVFQIFYQLGAQIPNIFQNRNTLCVIKVAAYLLLSHQVLFLFSIN